MVRREYLVSSYLLQNRGSAACHYLSMAALNAAKASLAYLPGNLQLKDVLRHVCCRRPNILHLQVTCIHSPVEERSICNYAREAEAEKELGKQLDPSTM